jgi:hypothetical protein
MSITKPQNRSEFKKHILTRLGAPVLEINVADEQLDICIDNAFQFFNERNHFNGVENAFLTTQVTPEFSNYFRSKCYKQVERHGCDDVMSGGRNFVGKQNLYIALPEDVVGVVQILQTGNSMVGGGVIPPGSIYPVLFGGMTGDQCGNMGFNLTTFYAMQGYLALMNFLLRPPQSWNFNQRTHRLSLHGDLNQFSVGGYIAIECLVKPNPDIFPDLWNDMWLKEMATAMVKHQWGQNLTKYNQVALPGGIVMNGDRILNDAQKELETIRTRFAMDWADPVTAMIVG